MKHLLTSLLILVAVPAFAQDEATLFSDTVNDWFETHDYVAVYNTPLKARYVLIGKESFSLIPDSIHLNVMPESEWPVYTRLIVSSGGHKNNDRYFVSKDGEDIIVSPHRDPDTGGLIVATLFGSEE